MSNDIWENHQRVSGTEEQQNNNEIVNPFFVTEIYLQDGSRWKMIFLVFTTRIEMQKQYDGDQKWPTLKGASAELCQGC